HSDGTVSIAKRCSPCFVIVLLFDAIYFGGAFLLAIYVKGITQTSLETSKARCLVLNHVVIANGISCAKGCTVVSLHEAGTKGASNTWHVLRGNGGLTTKGQLTPVITGETKVSFTAEQAIALCGTPIGNIKAALELEDEAQAITQVFGTS